MKRYIFSFLLIFISLSTFAQHSKKELIGEWKGADSQGVIASINFLDTAKISVTINGAPFPPYAYTIDFKKDPVTLDIAMTKPDGQQATLPGFLIFVDATTIKWQIFPDGKRPETYNEQSGGPIIVLKRIKK